MLFLDAVQRPNCVAVFPGEVGVEVTFSLREGGERTYTFLYELVAAELGFDLALGIAALVLLIQRQFSR